MPKRRDWTAAREKVDAEGQCRACGAGESSDVRLEAAHLWPRSMGGTQEPAGIVPLCSRLGPHGCHQLFDEHRLNLGHVLTTEEQAELVRQSGSLASAMRRAYPLDYREERAA